MTRFVWFHPNYVSDTSASTILGQKQNFETHGYVILNTEQLDQVRVLDHLTVIGRSLYKLKRVDEEQKQATTYNAQENENASALVEGTNIEGGKEEQFVQQLKQAGLKYAPKLLTLECNKVGEQGGLAQKLSNTLFFKYTLIEANCGSVGRNPQQQRWCYATDTLGRSTFTANDIWLFYASGFKLASALHCSYNLTDEEAVKKILDVNALAGFAKSFTTHYKPGFFNGRVGRYCKAANRPIDLEQALVFANEKPASATTEALDSTLKELFGATM